MTTEDEYQMPKDQRLMYIVRFRILAFKKDQENYQTLIESEFFEETPLKSRQLAFEYYRKVKIILKELEQKGLLCYKKPEMNEELSEGVFYGDIVFCDVYNWDRDRELVGKCESDFTNNLIFEYDYYIEQGFNTGKTIEITDNVGNIHKVIPYK